MSFGHERQSKEWINNFLSHFVSFPWTQSMWIAGEWAGIWGQFSLLQFFNEHARMALLCVVMFSSKFRIYISLSAVANKKNAASSITSAQQTPKVD